MKNIEVYDEKEAGKVCEEAEVEEATEEEEEKEEQELST